MEKEKKIKSLAKQIKKKKNVGFSVLRTCEKRRFNSERTYREGKRKKSE